MINVDEIYNELRKRIELTAKEIEYDNLFYDHSGDETYAELYMYNCGIMEAYEKINNVIDALEDVNVNNIIKAIGTIDPINEEAYYIHGFQTALEIFCDELVEGIYGDD